MKNLQTIYIPIKEVVSTNLIDYIEQRFSKIAPKDYIVREFRKDFKLTEGYFFTEEELKPLQDIVNEGYDAYDTAHHLVVQRWLKTIENFLNKEK